MTTLLRCENGHAFPALAGHASCPTCQALLDPVVDTKRLRRRTARSWRALFDKRAASTKPADASGVWLFRELVLPEVGDDVVTLGEGRSPLVPVGERTWIKQCGQQPTGSFKDLGMTVLVSAARRIKGVRALVCASTGDTSAALAAYGARAGLPVLVLLPAGKVSRAQLAQPLFHGARVVAIDGDFDAAMRVVQDVSRRPGVLLANSKNPLRLLGQMTVAFEIARDLAWQAPDAVVVPSGNLGNVFALHLGFTLLRDLGLTKRVPRLVAAQVAAADPLHRARDTGYATLTPVVAQDTLATAIRIGDPVSFPRARRALQESGGTTTSCSEQELAAAMLELDRQGILACPQTGAAWAGLRQLELARGARVVVVSTASGLKFVEGKLAVERNAPLPAAHLERVLQQMLSR